jgi:hypothetical protein
MRQNFTDEEWKVLLDAPMQAVMAVTLADKVDPISFLQELQAGIAIVGEEIMQQIAVGALPEALIAELKTADEQDPLSGEQLLLKKEFELLGLMQTFKNAKEGKAYAIAHFSKVADILAAKVTGVQAEEYKRWLLAVAEKVAAVQKEGGIMGIGSSRISEREAAVLKKLAEAIGLKA